MEDMMKEIKELFGKRIKELRKNLGLSQEELAEKAEISSRYLSRVEMGQQFPSIDTLIGRIQSRPWRMEFKNSYGKPESH